MFTSLLKVNLYLKWSVIKKRKEVTVAELLAKHDFISFNSTNAPDLLRSFGSEKSHKP